MLHHTLREGNMVADFMAKEGALGNKALVIYEYPPESVRAALPEDYRGTTFLRP